MNVLVIGGAGYIGSTVTAALSQAGHHPVVFDNLSNGHAQALPRDTELIVGDIRDAAALDTLFSTRKIDAVMHFAALIEVGESMKAPEKFFRVNTASTLTLLEAMLRHQIGKIVFSSTAALFGTPNTIPITEDAPIQPSSVYGETKFMVERMLDWFGRIHGLRFACLRYFNAAGAPDPDHGEAHSPESHLIPLILQVALGQRSSISIFGTDFPTPDGTCIRDYIHVSDLASAHILALDTLMTRERLHYNLGNGTGFSVREVIETARKVTGHSIPTIETSRRTGDPAILIASSESIRRDLGWTPNHPTLQDIIGSAWEWHRRHPTGYKG